MGDSVKIPAINHTLHEKTDRFVYSEHISSSKSFMPAALVLKQISTRDIITIGDNNFLTVTAGFV